ncbi:MAG: 6,7-dimethyl-8-ribityllumazine synthase [Chthoniobacterales bacterium]
MLKPLLTRPRQALRSTNRIAIVASRYNGEFVEAMVAKALAEIALIEPDTKTEVIHAPGSFEIPFLARQLIEQSKPDAVICLGVIFEGATGHANLIAASVSDALCLLSVEALTPVIHGVLLLGNQEQARERCLGEELNRGTEAARAAIEVIRSSRSISNRSI